MKDSQRCREGVEKVRARPAYAGKMCSLGEPRHAQREISFISFIARPA